MKTWKDNWEESRARYVEWWNGKGVLISMWEHLEKEGVPHENISAPAPAKNLNQQWFDTTWRADQLNHQLSRASFKGDILPVANTQLGPGSLAALLGSSLEGGEDTIWIHPATTPTDNLIFNPENEGWKLHLDLLKACKQRAKGNYFVGMPDLMEGLDILAAIRGTDIVLMDTVINPELLDRQLHQVNEIYFKVFDELYNIIREENEMAFCYFSIWGPGKVSKLQSDISTMISEEDYRRFVLPYLKEQCQKIDYTLYHLDGVGAIRHLDAILEIEELNAIQWTPGVGEPQGGDPKWYDLYRKILSAGKSIMPCWVTLNELCPLLDEVGANGLNILMDFKHEGEIDQAMKMIEPYR